MTVSNLDKSLHDCIDRLNDGQKKVLLDFIENMLPAGIEEVYTVEQYNKELEDANAAIDRGEFYTNEDVFAMAQEIINGSK